MWSHTDALIYQRTTEAFKSLSGSRSRWLHLRSFDRVTARRYHHPLTKENSVHKQQDVTVNVTGDSKTLNRPRTSHITYEKDYLWFLCLTFIRCVTKPDDPDVTHQKRMHTQHSLHSEKLKFTFCLFSQRMYQFSHFNSSSIYIYVPQAITVCTHAEWHTVHGKKCPLRQLIQTGVHL